MLGGSEAIDAPTHLDVQERFGTLGDIHLVLFMTAGMSLSAWDRLGMFEREIALYRRLRPALKAMTVVSYGDQSDLALRDRLPGIDVICNRYGLPPRVYRWLLRQFYPRRWRGRVVVKTNQTAGADIALAAARTAQGKFIARCGYMLSEFTARAYGMDSQRTHSDAQLEKTVFTAADRCVVTTGAMAAAVAGYGVPPHRIRVIPNYVETDRLQPTPERRQQHRILFVGRLDRQKNVFALLEAMQGIDAELVVIGDGPDARVLKQIARENGLLVDFRGRVRHQDLPAVMNSCSLFVLPSHYEGHPKALLEAMSCGLPVIGTDVSGIREVIRHGETGWLCGTDATSLRQAIMRLLSDADLREHLGCSARKEILQTCSLDRVYELETRVLCDLFKSRDTE